MSRRRDIILQAIECRQNPSADHIRLRELLQNQQSTQVYQEYVAVDINDQPELVNFYNESEQVAITIGNENQKKVYGSMCRITVARDTLRRPERFRLRVGFLSHDTSVQNALGGKSTIATEEQEALFIEETDPVDIPQVLHFHAVQERDNISEIIGHPPGWLLRSGITVLATITCILLSLAHVIRYPDKLMATGYVTTETPPLAMVAPASTIIDMLLVQTGDIVMAGDPLLYLKNTASLRDIILLKDWISRVDQGLYPNLSNQLVLGPLQDRYAQLLLLLDEHQEVTGHQAAESQINTIQEELTNINRLNTSLTIEEEHYTNEHQLAQSEIARSNKLYSEGLISKQELENAERQYEQFVRQLQATKKTKVQNDIRQDQLTLEAKKIKEQRATELMQYRFKINQQITALSADIRAWEDQYFIHADHSGVIEWRPTITEKATIKAGEELGYIIPDRADNQKVIKSKVSVAGAGEITPGSKCIVRFDAYPYKEHGTLIETLDQMALLPEATDQGAIYDIAILLPDTMRTDYGHIIPYRPHMTLSMDIITDDKSILERIFHQFLDLIKN